MRREALGLSRRDIADRSGLSYPYVSQLENGDREPSMDALGRLAVALEATTEELLTAPPVGRAGRTASAPSPAAAMPAAPAATPSVPPAPVSAMRDSVGGSAEAALWHANPGFAATRRPSSRRSPVDAVVDEAYLMLSQLAPAERLDAAGILLARCLRDANPPE